jgi:hypothetical protein
MSTLLEYRGYIGSVEHSDQDEVFFGRLEFWTCRVFVPLQVLV